jgi:hypothetical protein
MAAAIHEGAYATVAMTHQEDRNAPDIERQIAPGCPKITGQRDEGGLSAEEVKALALEVIRIDVVCDWKAQGARRQITRLIPEMRQEAPDAFELARSFQAIPPSGRQRA